MFVVVLCWSLPSIQRTWWTPAFQSVGEDEGKDEDEELVAGPLRAGGTGAVSGDVMLWRAVSSAARQPYSLGYKHAKALHDYRAPCPAAGGGESWDGVALRAPLLKPSRCGHA